MSGMFESGHAFYEMPRKLRELIIRINQGSGRVLYGNLGFMVSIPGLSLACYECIDSGGVNELISMGILKNTLKRHHADFDIKEWWDLIPEYVWNR